MNPVTRVLALGYEGVAPYHSGRASKRTKTSKTGYGGGNRPDGEGGTKRQTARPQGEARPLISFPVVFLAWGATYFA